MTAIYHVELNKAWYLAFGLTALIPVYTITKFSILSSYQSLQLARAKRSNGLQKLTWRQFEHMTAAYFRSLGYRAVVVGGKGQGDGG
ncbi:MAG: hypothetical protein KAG66_21120, partial [Methylococcales bacterium]|nr:hypothetical protein [Methylococcales bacterium]